jgi:hypothetical protein
VLVVREYDTYFVCKKNCVVTVGFSSIKKFTVVLRILAYGAHVNTRDDYMRMTRSTAIECLYQFNKAVVEVLGEPYLRAPTGEDTTRIMAQNARG